MRRTLAAMMVLALVLSVGALRGETVVDAKRGFSFKTPEGFSPAPADRKSPTFSHTFILGDPSDDTPDISLGIQPLGGVIGREHLKTEDVPKGLNGRVFLAKWKGFDVDGIESRMTVEGYDVLSLGVQVPIRTEAIQVNVAGLASREKELRQYLSEVLASLDGQTNWIPSAIPGSFTSSESYGYILFGATAVIVIGGAVVFFFMGRKRNEAWLVAAGVLVWCGGFIFPSVGTREIMMLSGSVHGLGVVVFLMGLVLLVFRAVRAARAKRGGESGGPPS
jgi:hypothetical protein